MIYFILGFIIGFLIGWIIGVVQTYQVVNKDK